MTEDIRRRDEIEEQSIPYYLHQQKKKFAQHEKNNIEFQKEMIQRMTRVETQLEHLNTTIEKFISKNDVQLDNINKRIDLMERKLDEAEGAIKMLRWLSGALAGIITGLIGILTKYVR